MLGKSANCAHPEKRDCADCYRSCEHTTKIRDQFTQEAGTKGPIKTLIDAHLELQEQFLQEMCNATPDLKSLAQLSGMRCAAFADQGCIDFCGQQKRLYLSDNCACDDHDFDDDFYKSVIQARRIKKTATRATLREIADLFGWSITYTPDFIGLDIGSGQTEKAFSILHIFPVPLGESLRVIGNC